MSRSEAPQTFSDVPLTSPEISHASGLLLRASKHGQLYLIEESMKNAPNVKQFLVSAKHSLAMASTAAGDGYPTPSGMTDASKRRLPDDDNQSWENVSCSAATLDQATFIAGMPEHVPVPSCNKDGTNPVLRVMMEAMEDKKIPLPEGVIDLMTWGRMICETDKYKEADLLSELPPQAIWIEARTSQA